MNWKRKIKQWIGLQPRAKPKIHEQKTQFEGLPESANRIQVIIGLDFGTSFTKVVIGVKGQKYGVPLNDNKRGTDKYLLPTRIYEGSSGNYSVDQLADCVSSHTDLKMRILNHTHKLDGHTRNRIVTYIA